MSQAYGPARRLLQTGRGSGGGCITDLQCSQRCFGGGHIYINSGACSTVCICSASAAQANGQSTASPLGGGGGGSLGSSLYTPIQQGTFSPGLFGSQQVTLPPATEAPSTLTGSLDASTAATTAATPPPVTIPPLATLPAQVTPAPTLVGTQSQQASNPSVLDGSLGSTTAGTGAGGGTLAGTSGTGSTAAAGGGTAQAGGKGGSTTAKGR